MKKKMQMTEIGIKKLTCIKFLNFTVHFTKTKDTNFCFFTSVECLHIQQNNNRLFSMPLK